MNDTGISSGGSSKTGGSSIGVIYSPPYVQNSTALRITPNILDFKEKKKPETVERREDLADTAPVDVSISRNLF